MTERLEASLESVQEYLLTIPAQSLFPRTGNTPISRQTASSDDAVIFAITDSPPDQGADRTLKVEVKTFNLPGDRKGILQICFQNKPIAAREIEVAGGNFETAISEAELGPMPQEGNAAPWSYQVVLFPPEITSVQTFLQSMRTEIALNIQEALTSADYRVAVKLGESVSEGPIDFFIEKENHIRRAKIHVEHGTPVQRGRIILRHKQGHVVYYWDLPAEQWNIDAGTEGDFELNIPPEIQVPEEVDFSYELEIFQKRDRGAVYR